MTTEFDFPEDTRDTLDLAMLSLRSAISGYGQTLDFVALIETAKEVWTAVNSNPELKKKIDEDIRQKRVALNQVAAINIARDGDPVRRRYDPHTWLEHIPPEFKLHPGWFVMERSQTLLAFLEAFKRQK